MKQASLVQNGRAADHLLILSAGKYDFENSVRIALNVPYMYISGAAKSSGKFLGSGLGSQA
jgi:hypothetical protein